MDNEKWKKESCSWKKKKNGYWKMNNGKWEIKTWIMNNGKWKMAKKIGVNIFVVPKERKICFLKEIYFFEKWQRKLFAPLQLANKMLVV